MKKYTSIIIALFVLLAATATAPSASAEPRDAGRGLAAETYGNVTVTKIISVYDGDTFRCDIAGYPPIIGKNVGIRIYGIDTPEIRGGTAKTKALGRQAKALTKRLLESAKVIELRDIRRGKYFRIVGDVYIDGKSLREMLIDAGLAKPYFGGKKIKWTD